MVLSYISCKIIWMFTFKMITLNQDLYIFVFKLHSNIRVHLLVCLKYSLLMHRHRTYRTVNFVNPALCLVAVHPIGILVHTAICNLDF